LHSTIGTSRRLHAALSATGLTPQDLTTKHGIDPDSVRALLDEDLLAVNALALLRLMDALPGYSITWLFGGSGSPGAKQRLEPDEAWVVSVYKSLSERGREIVHHALKNLTT
jgi:hypothetical protein